MIVRDYKNKPLTPLDKLNIEKELYALAQAEDKASLQNFARQAAEIICENAVCIADSKGNGITIKLLNGQIFKLTVKELK